MRPLAVLFRVVSVIIVLLIFLTCNDLKLDECDSYTVSQISIGVQVSVLIRDKNNLPMKDQKIEVYVYKVPCGAPAKGEFRFDGVTDASGNFNSTVANYNIRNRKDKIGVRVVGLDIMLGGTVNTNEKEIFLEFHEFSDGVTRNVEVLLYTNE